MNSLCIEDVCVTKDELTLLKRLRMENIADFKRLHLSDRWCIDFRDSPDPCKGHHSR